MSILGSVNLSICQYTSQNRQIPKSNTISVFCGRRNSNTMGDTEGAPPLRLSFNIGAVCHLSNLTALYSDQLPFDAEREWADDKASTGVFEATFLNQVFGDEVEPSHRFIRLSEGGTRLLVRLSGPGTLCGARLCSVFSRQRYAFVDSSAGARVRCSCVRRYAMHDFSVSTSSCSAICQSLVPPTAVL